MKAIFWTREEIGKVAASDERESNLAKALRQGADEHDTVEIRVAESAWEPEVIPCDLVILAGVKSRVWFEAYARAGIPWLYWDKGYIRERAADQWLSYWRLSVNSHHPIAFLERAELDSARSSSMGSAFRFAPWKQGEHILVDGGSEKNFKFNGIVPESATIGDVDAHCAKLVEKIKRFGGGRPVIYRPKPSSQGRHGIKGTEFAYKTRAGVHKKDVNHDLERAWAVVTYNGAISWDGNRIGIPSIVLGSGPGRPISSTHLESLHAPYLASDKARQQWLNNLAWCQFSPREIRAGLPWPIIKQMIKLTPIKTPAEACPCIPL